MRIQQQLDFIGNLGMFTLRAATRAVVPPLEVSQIWRQIEEIGCRSLPIVVPAGFALGVVLTLHTRSTLIRFGAQSIIPSVQSISFFNELGPLVTGLLVAGRGGADIGAALADMRSTEQIDAIEVFSIDRSSFL